MKKKNFCTETKRVVYANPKEKTSYCKLDCIVELFPDQEIITWDLAQELGKKFPMLKYQYGDVFHIHIETKATCQAGDTFDARRGKTIAYSKAQFKLYHLIGRIYQYMEVYFARATAKAEEAKNMFARYAVREASFLDSI